jgi:hypothetical protein
MEEEEKKAVCDTSRQRSFIYLCAFLNTVLFLQLPSNYRPVKLVITGKACNSSYAITSMLISYVLLKNAYGLHAYGLHALPASNSLGLTCFTS